MNFEIHPYTCGQYKQSRSHRYICGTNGITLSKDMHMYMDRDAKPYHMCTQAKGSHKGAQTDAHMDSNSKVKSCI